MWNNTSKVASIGDLVQLVGLRHKSYIFNVVEDKELHTHRGIIKHDDLHFVGLEENYPNFVSKRYRLHFIEDGDWGRTTCG